jgi:hypothetical protein
VNLDTPEGAKSLAADGDARRLVEDTESRRKLVAVGKDFAVVCTPALSDFAKGEVHLGVYSGVHAYKHGEVFDGDAAWRVYPIALPTGLVVGLYVVNDRAIELRPDAPTVAGPAGSFKVVTTWSPSGELESFGVDDAKGGQSARVSGKGRASIDMLAGGGPTIESLVGRSHLAPLQDSGSRATPQPSAAQPATPASSAPPAGASRSWRDDPVAFAKPHLAWVGGGALLGFLLAAVFGVMRRRPRSFDHDDY